MSFQKPEPRSNKTEKQKEWDELAIAFMKTKGPDDEGVLGYAIRRGQKEIGNRWIDWLWSNGFREAARALAPMVKAKGAYFVPCKNPDEFELWMKSQGKDARSLPYSIQPIGKPNRARKRQFNSMPMAHLTALEMCRSGLGRKAQNEGWIIQLYEFCRDVGGYPDDRERLWLMAQARRVQKSVLINDAHSQQHKGRREKIESQIWGTLADAAE